MFTDALSGLMEGQAAPGDIDALAGKLVISRSAISDNGTDAEVWNRVFRASPAELTGALLNNLPEGSRLTVSFYGRGGAVLLVRDAEGELVLDVERAPGADLMFLRKLGRKRGATGGHTFKQMLHNLAISAKALQVTRVELISQFGDTAGWTACGFKPIASAWTGILQPALTQRFDWLMQIPPTSHESMPESIEQTVRRLLADEHPRTIWKLTDSGANHLGHRFADLLFAADLPDLLGHAGDEELPGAVESPPQWAASLDLKRPKPVQRMMGYLGIEPKKG
ncbi:MAG: hypothetical protein Alpg2KO_32720 [Alphaproteobacteria bacterium]